jgi:hypothetical protein
LSPFPPYLHCILHSTPKTNQECRERWNDSQNTTDGWWEWGKEHIGEVAARPTWVRIYVRAFPDENECLQQPKSPKTCTDKSEIVLAIQMIKYVQTTACIDWVLFHVSHFVLHLLGFHKLDKA